MPLVWSEENVGACEYICIGLWVIPLQKGKEENFVWGFRVISPLRQSKKKNSQRIQGQENQIDLNILCWTHLIYVCIGRIQFL